MIQNNWSGDNLERIVNFRLFDDIYDRILDSVDRDPQRFPSTSDFIRIAIMQLLRDVEQEEKK